jgi:hypothetical protein
MACFVEKGLQQLLTNHHGRAVHVDPMRPTLKAPECKRLKLDMVDRFRVLLSNSNLRRYIMGAP